MHRTLLAIIIATSVAAPAAAQSFQVFLPNLTYPPQPIAPIADQSCVDLTVLTETTCPTVEK
jgi:hypothetical protein